MAVHGRFYGVIDLALRTPTGGTSSSRQGPGSSPVPQRKDDDQMIPMWLARVIYYGIKGSWQMLSERQAKDVVAKRSKLRGYCSNCGELCLHKFETSGLTKGKTALTIALGPLGFTSVLALRNVYKCTECGHRTLPCRMPNCTGMARGGDYYDDEFCGRCRKANDNSLLYQAYTNAKMMAKVTAIIQGLQQELDQMTIRLKHLEMGTANERAKHAQEKEVLQRHVAEKEAELQELRRVVKEAEK